MGKRWLINLSNSGPSSAFINVYAAAAGPVTRAEFDLIIPAIRCRRLIEILTALRGIAMGEAWDESPAALCDFLAAGDPPVYIGFGSMPDSKPQATTRLFIDAVQQRGDHQSTGGRI
jgi:hypothetical protein